MPPTLELPFDPGPPAWLHASPRPRRRELLPPTRRVVIEPAAYVVPNGSRADTTRPPIGRGLAEVAIAIVATIGFGFGWAAWELHETDASVSVSGYDPTTSVAPRAASAAERHATPAWRIDTRIDDPDAVEVPAIGSSTR